MTDQPDYQTRLLVQDTQGIRVSEIKLTYAILSHGGRSRTWQKTWQSRSAGSPCPYSSCMRHIRQKCAMRCCRVLEWWDGKELTSSHSADSVCSAVSVSSHHHSSITVLLKFTASFNMKQCNMKQNDNDRPARLSDHIISIRLHTRHSS